MYYCINKYPINSYITIDIGATAMQIVQNVYLFESTKGSYVYLINEHEPVLIDTGHKGKFKQIVQEVSNWGINPKDIKHIFLTHHDTDHIGNAKLLRDLTGAKLWASREDMPFIIGSQERPGLKKMIQSIVKVDTPIIDDIFPSNFQSIDIIPTPGHTPGHTAFLYKKVLFVGDLVFNFNGTLKFLPSFFNWNVDILKSSLQKIKAVDFEWICTAHGEPIRRENIKNWL